MGSTFSRQTYSNWPSSGSATRTGAVEEFRLMRNMLSSQPMCFNLFGKLALNHDMATDMVRTLWGAHVKRVTDVRFEWAPQPTGEYLG